MRTKKKIWKLHNSNSNGNGNGNNKNDIVEFLNWNEKLLILCGGDGVVSCVVILKSMGINGSQTMGNRQLSNR